MEWIKRLNSAVEYMEAHLLEKIDYEKVAEIANSSAFSVAITRVTGFSSFCNSFATKRVSHSGLNVECFLVVIFGNDYMICNS